MESHRACPHGGVHSGCAHGRVVCRLDILLFRGPGCCGPEFRVHGGSDAFTPGLDVVASPSSQAYIGVTDDRTAHEAQEMTRGMVLAWGDQLVPGYFSSCCGGLAATAIGRISTSAVNDVPPLMGHDGRDHCTNSPLYDWTIDRSARTLHRRVNAWADHTGHQALGSLTSVKSITVQESNRHGRPTILRITDRSNRTADVDLQDFLSAANFDGSGSPPMRSKSLWSGWSTGSVDRGRVTLSGHGFGHGVGLCQYGAQELGNPWKVLQGNSFLVLPRGGDPRGLVMFCRFKAGSSTRMGGETCLNTREHD